MRKLSLIVMLFSCYILAAAAQERTTEQIVFKGTADAKYDGSVIIIYNNNPILKDSATVKDGKFEFSVPFKQPSIYGFMSKYEQSKKGGYTPLGVMIAGPGTVSLDADMEKLTNSAIRNAPDNDIYAAFSKESAAARQQVMGKLDQKFGAAFMKALTEKDPQYPEVLKFYNELNAPNKIAEQERLSKLIKANPNSFAAIYIVNSMMSDLPVDKSERLYSLLGPKYKNEDIGKGILASINAAHVIALGKIAPDFEQADTAGKMVKLSGFRGKYVLIDFWASWCGPCRAENPNVVKAYRQYHDKGFTVLGVSLDQPGKKEAWLKAIHQDQLSWTQVSDLQFWNNAVAKLYGIRSIPQNFLLDKDGKIIAINIKGGELRKKLGEIFPD